MKPIYTTLSEIVNDYPLIYAVNISNIDLKVAIYVNVSIKQEGDVSWTFLDTSPSVGSLEGINNLPQITHLDFSDKDFSKINKLFENNSLLNLTSLEIGFIKTDKILGNSALRLPKYLNLKELTLYGWKEVHFESYLEQLTTLRLLYCDRIFLPDILSKLNPKNLTFLEIFNIKKLLFFDDTNIKKRTKKEPETRVFKALQDFTNLTYLGLRNNRLDKLPFSLAPFQKLEILNIAKNKLTDIPIDFLYLPALKRIDIRGTPIIKQKTIRGGNELIKMMRHFDKKNIENAEREILIKILLEDKNIEALTSIESLLHLLTLVENPALAMKLIALCETKVVQNPFQNNQSITHITLLGKLPAISTKDAQAFFEGYQIKLETKITPETQIVCIAGKPNETQILAIHKSETAKRTFEFCFPTHLKNFMAQLDTPYLTISESEITQNLQNLLQSGDENNALLAFQMMKNGGLPALFFEFLCIQLIRNNWGCKKELVILLEKYATHTQFMLIKKLKNSCNDFQKDIQLLLRSPNFDTKKIVKSVFKFYRDEQPMKKFDRFLFILNGEIWKTDKEAVDLVVDHCLKADGTLFINNEFSNITKIPATLKGNTAIIKLIVKDKLIQTNVSKEIVKSMPNLQALEVLCKKEDLVEKKTIYQSFFKNMIITFVTY